MDRTTNNFDALKEKYIDPKTRHILYEAYREKQKDKKVHITRMPANYRNVNLHPYRIWQNQPYTTVEWEDGEKTTVKAESYETMTLYGGFTACLAKRIFGTTSNAIRALETAMHTAELPKLEKRKIREMEKEKRQKAHQMRIEEHEKEVLWRMNQMRINREAELRLAEEDRKEENAK